MHTPFARDLRRFRSLLLIACVGVGLSGCSTINLADAAIGGAATVIGVGAKAAGAVTGAAVDAAAGASSAVTGGDHSRNRQAPQK